MNTGVQISLWDPAFDPFGNSARSRIARSYDNYLSIFLGGTTMLFSIATAQFYIPTDRAQCFQFLHILANICYFIFCLFVLCDGGRLE